eukprot:scaffold4691_cov62-Phaeocystis_antarctica.AAC.4
MKSPHSKLLRKCVADEKALRVGGGGPGSAHRGPAARKKTPVEDADDRPIERQGCEGTSIATPCSVRVV